MALILPLFLLITGFLAGVTVCGKKDSMPDTGEACLFGMFSLFLLWEVLYCICGLTGFSMKILIMFYSCFLILVTVLAFMAFYNRRHLKHWHSDINFDRSYIAAIVLFVLQLVFMMINGCVLENDAFYEEVIRASGTSVDAVIRPVTEGVSGYAVFASYLAYVSGGNEKAVLGIALPVFMLMLEYLVCFRWIKLICADNANASGMVLSFVGLLNICGSLAGKGAFFSVLFKGYLPENLIYVVLAPLTACVFMEWTRNKDGRRFVYIALILTASVFTRGPEGLIAPLLVLFICIAVYLFATLKQKWRRA